MLARDRDAVAEALNLVEDRRDGPRAAALELLGRLEREAPFPGAPRIGITGPPGAGKSSLLDALVRELRPRGERLAIVAVDPSSQRSGGALLGDRIRVRAAAADPGVFLRSMAARDRLGGLSEATRAAVVILGAAFDRVFVETVGVGQSEVEAAALVDTLVYVANPGTGDWLQFMKAGVLETPDVFVVNKSDLGAPARATAAELEGGIGLGEAADAGWNPPVILVSAREGTGMDALVDALDAHRADAGGGGRAGRAPPARQRELDPGRARAPLRQLRARALRRPRGAAREAGRGAARPRPSRVSRSSGARSRTPCASRV